MGYGSIARTDRSEDTAQCGIKLPNEVRGSTWGIVAASSIFCPRRSELPIKNRHTFHLVSLGVATIESVFHISLYILDPPWLARLSI